MYKYIINNHILKVTSRECFNQVGSGDSNNQGGEVRVAHQNINKCALAENNLETKRFLLSHNYNIQFCR